MAKQCTLPNWILKRLGTHPIRHTIGKVSKGETLALAAFGLRGNSNDTIVLGRDTGGFVDLDSVEPECCDNRRVPLNKPVRFS
jgi:hypothetical protein